MQPCERLLNDRVHERYAYRDGRLLGTWDQTSTGRVFARSRRSYDAEGRLLAAVGQYNFADVSYEGDRLSEMALETQESRTVYHFEYDAGGRPAQLQSQAGGEPRVTTRYVWQQDRLLAEETDAILVHDPDTQRLVPAPGSSSVHYQYDARGYLKCFETMERGARHATCFEYDAQRRVVGIGQDIRFHYDEQGRLIGRHEIRQVSQERRVELNETWRYDCTTPAQVAQLFEPIPRDHVLTCFPSCQTAYREAYPDLKTEFRVPCRSYCEKVGRHTPPPVFE